MTQQEFRTAIIPTDVTGWRLDKVLPLLFAPYSRTQLQDWLSEGRLTMDGSVPSKRQVVQGGEHLSLCVSIKAPQDWQPQRLPLNIVYEDTQIAVVDKPAGVVVHPGAGNPDATLANAILYHYPENRLLARAGIVHRLDKGTTGLLVIARTEVARQKLVEDFELRTISRQYVALVYGQPIAGETIDRPICRHPRDRRRMAVSDKGKSAVTHFTLERRYQSHTLLRVRLDTGRTHQIRVHLAEVGLPIVGDALYGGRLRIPSGASSDLIMYLRQFKRQALHATELSIVHPESGDRLTWKSPLPEDFFQLLEALKSSRHHD